MKIAILGAGAWGTALSTVFAHNGHDVLLWAHEHNVVEDINQFHENKDYLPGINLAASIDAVNDIQQAVQCAQIIIVAIPVVFLRSVLQQVAPCITVSQLIVIASKGIEQQTMMLPTQIVQDLLDVKVSSVVLSGPSFARDVAQQQLTGLVLASQDHASATQVKQLIENRYVVPVLSSDVIGVQLAGALKNVLALGVGLVEGAGFKDNSRAYLFTQILHEIVVLGLKLGAQRETFYGLAGIGDMVLTATGDLSKNKRIGRVLGAGLSLDELVSQKGCLPEGINTVQSLQQLMHMHQLHMPFCASIYDVIFKGKSVKKIFD